MNSSTPSAKTNAQRSSKSTARPGKSTMRKRGLTGLVICKLLKPCSTGFQRCPLDLQRRHRCRRDQVHGPVIHYHSTSHRKCHRQILQAEWLAYKKKLFATSNAWPPLKNSSASQKILPLRKSFQMPQSRGSPKAQLATAPFAPSNARSSQAPHQ